MEGLPASMAFRAASLKSFTIWGISSVLNRLGGEHPVSGANPLSVLEIGACPLGWKPINTNYIERQSMNQLLVAGNNVWSSLWNDNGRSVKPTFQKQALWPKSQWSQGIGLLYLTHLFFYRRLGLELLDLIDSWSHERILEGHSRVVVELQL